MKITEWNHFEDAGTSHVQITRRIQWVCSDKLPWGKSVAIFLSAYSSWGCTATMGDPRCFCKTDEDDKNTPHLIKENSSKGAVRAFYILMMRVGMSGFKSRKWGQIALKSLHTSYGMLQMLRQVERRAFLSATATAQEHKCLLCCNCFDSEEFFSCQPRYAAGERHRAKGSVPIFVGERLSLNLSGQCVSISIALGDLELEPVSKTGLLLFKVPEAICLSAEWNRYSQGQVFCSSIQPTPLIFPSWQCWETQQSHWVDAGGSCETPKEHTSSKGETEKQIVFLRMSYGDFLKTTSTLCSIWFTILSMKLSFFLTFSSCSWDQSNGQTICNIISSLNTKEIF